MSLSMVAKGAQSGRSIYKPASQICNSVKSRKNTVFMQPQNATTVAYTGTAGGVLNSASNTFTDFLIDPTLGYVSDITLRVALQFSDAVHLPSIVPTPYFCNRVEVWSPDNTLVETVYPEQIYTRAVATLWDQDRTLVANSYNINPDGSQRNLYFNGTGAGSITYDAWVANNTVQPSTNSGATPSLPVYVSPSTYLYVPLTDTCLRAGIFIAGYAGQWKIRVYWASNIISQLAIDPTPVPVLGTYLAYPQSITVNQPTLVVEEDTVDPATFNSVLKAHREGVVDTTVIVQERMQIINNSTFSNNTIQNFYLTGFRNKCAGMMMHFQPPNPANDRILQRLSFAQVQFLDARGNRIWTQLLDTDFLNSKLWGEALNSTYPQSAQADIQSLSVVSFCADLDETLKKGCAGGSVVFTSQEQISITPSINAPPVSPNLPVSITGFTNPMLYLTSYSYAHISCVQGKSVIRWD